MAGDWLDMESTQGDPFAVQRRRCLLFAITAAALFGAATPLSKLLLGALPPVQMAGLLYLGAALGLLPLILRRRRVRLPWQYDRATQRRLAGAILFGGVLGPVLLLLGLQRAAAGSVSLWLNLEAVATALLGFLVFHDRLDRLGWLGAAGIVCASLLLSWGEGAAGWRAGVLVALASLCWGVDNHLTALIDGISPAESTLWKGLAAGTVNIALAVALERTVWPAAPVAGALAIGVLAYGASIVLYISAAQQMGATRSQLIFSSAPYFGLAMAVIFLGERLTWQQGVAGLIIAASVLLLTFERHGHNHEHATLTHDHAHDHEDAHHTHPHDGAHVGGKAAGAPLRHSHLHTHVTTVHSHPHLPDLHHRHEHGAA